MVNFYYLKGRKLPFFFFKKYLNLLGISKISSYITYVIRDDTMSKYKFKNRKFPKDFQKVVDFISDKKGIRVQLSQMTNFTGHFNRTINIHHNYDLNNNGLYALLHECGHALQPPTNVGVNSYKNIDSDEHPKQFVLGRLMNEIDAWDKGLEIANQLGIQINMKSWNKEKEEALITYLVL